jgi:hypothetical protein
MPRAQLLLGTVVVAAGAVVVLAKQFKSKLMENKYSLAATLSLRN